MTIQTSVEILNRTQFFILFFSFLLCAIIATAIGGEPDDDNDGVKNSQDACPESSPFHIVDQNGCLASITASASCNNGGIKALPWTCAASKPNYCRGGASPTLEDNCATCGCPDEDSCQEDGSCLPLSTLPAAIPLPAIVTAPSHSTDCYDKGNKSSCDSFGCFWDSTYFDECIAFCSELSDADCANYGSCLLMETGSFFGPKICVDPYELKDNIQVSFSSPAGEISEGESETIALTIPPISIARRDPRANCDDVALYDDFSIEWECNDDDNPPLISITITALADGQCEGDEIAQYSLGCDQDLCTIQAPQTHTIIIHDNAQDCG